MVIGCDNSGKIWLVSAGDNPAVMPAELNGMALTVYTLTPAQRAAFLALDPLRGGTMFDGQIFAAIPAAPPTVIDLSNLDNLDKALKALGLVCAAWNGKTPAQLKAAFTTAWNSLP